MASNAANTTVAQPRVTGAIRNAPKGTAGPTDHSTALASEWVDLGYIGEDGVTETISRDTDKKKAWGGATVRVLQTSYDNTFSFVFMESKNADVLKRIYGESNVTVGATDGTIVVDKNKKPLPVESWVIDTEDGDDIDRVWIPEGQITEVGDVVRVHTDTIAYEVTIEAFESSAIGGSNSRDFKYVKALDTTP